MKKIIFLITLLGSMSAYAQEMLAPSYRQSPEGFEQTNYSAGWAEDIINQYGNIIDRNLRSRESALSDIILIEGGNSNQRAAKENYAMQIYQCDVSSTRNSCNANSWAERVSAYNAYAISLHACERNIGSTEPHLSRITCYIRAMNFIAQADRGSINLVRRRCGAFLRSESTQADCYKVQFRTLSQNIVAEQNRRRQNRQRQLERLGRSSAIR